MRQFKILAQIALALTLLGCATEKKQLLDVQQLQTQISRLETELQQKNEEVLQLEQRLEDTQQGAISPLSHKQPQGLKSKTSKKNPRNIQIALRNAGFYAGPIDGKIGKKTTQAVKQFQKAKGLTADGIAGKQTWLKLRQFLD